MLAILCGLGFSFLWSGTLVVRKRIKKVQLGFITLLWLESTTILGLYTHQKNKHKNIWVIYCTVVATILYPTLDNQIADEKGVVM